MPLLYFDPMYLNDCTSCKYFNIANTKNLTKTFNFWYIFYYHSFCKKKKKKKNKKKNDDNE